MGLTGFLRIPDVPGESVADGHEGEIEIDGLNWGIARTSTRALTVFKGYDVASPYLTLSAAQGRGFDEVVLTLGRDSGDGMTDTVTIAMERVTVTSYDIEHSEAGSGLRERVSLSFERVKVFYRVPPGRFGSGDEHQIGFEVLRPR